MQSVGLIEGGRNGDPLQGRVAPEGISALRMLAATRPLELNDVPVGRAAVAAFGAPGTDAECQRFRFAEAEGRARRLPAGFVREVLFAQPAISLLWRDLDDPVPLARTIWSLLFLDADSRDRTYAWLRGRVDRWTAWGELARAKGAPALTQALFALLVLDEAGGPEDGRSVPPLAIAHGR